MPKPYDPKTNKSEKYKVDPGAAIGAVHKMTREYREYENKKEHAVKQSPDLSEMIQVFVGLPGNLCIWVKQGTSDEEIEQRKQNFLNNYNPS